MASLFNKDPVEAEFEELSGEDRPVFGFGGGAEPQRKENPDAPKCAPLESPIEQSRALALADVIAPRARPGETLIRLAYRMGVPGHALAAPFRRASPIRVLATVESPYAGDRAAGIALRAGHFLVHGVKQPIHQLDFDSHARLAPGLERCVHSFSWLMTWWKRRF